VTHPAVFDSLIIAGRTTLRFYLAQDGLLRKINNENTFQQVRCRRFRSTKFRKVQKQKAGYKEKKWIRDFTARTGEE
jgi:hypothetical protein